MYFVGVSGRLASEQLARDDAMRDSTNKVVSYLGTLAKDKFERARISFGLSSTVVDPTEASRRFEKQLAANVTRQFKAKEWYGERWVLETGTAWKMFVLARMPQENVNQALAQTAEENIKQAQEDAKWAATETAKQQAKDAAEFWQQMKEEGLVD
jgi:transcriptional regulator with AAA-type ATPase domain